MAFCSKCGSQLNDGDKVCGSCGTPVLSERRIPAVRTTLVSWVILAYLGILALVPYLVKDQPAFVHAHAVRGNESLFTGGYLPMGCGWHPLLGADSERHPQQLGRRRPVSCFSLIGIIYVAEP